MPFVYFLTRFLQKKVILRAESTKKIPHTQVYAGFSLPGCYFFFTPWYSSTVFVVMVVVTLDVSLACV